MAINLMKCRNCKHHEFGLPDSNEERGKMGCHATVSKNGKIARNHTPKFIEGVGWCEVECEDYSFSNFKFRIKTGQKSVIIRRQAV